MLNFIYERVGTTRSKRMIPYVSDHKNISQLLRYFRNENFSMDDFLDVFALYEFLALRAIRRRDGEAVYRNHANAIIQMISTEDLAEAKVRTNVFSAFQLRDLGKSLAAIEFIDF